VTKDLAFLAAFSWACGFLVVGPFPIEAIGAGLIPLSIGAVVLWTKRGNPNRLYIAGTTAAVVSVLAYLGNLTP